MASPFLTANKPTISKVQSGLTQGSGITLMAPGLTARNYNIITNPVKTSSGKIIDAADTQTISYSSSMKKAAENLAKNGNIVEKAAAQYYLFMDDPTKIGSAKYYENKLKKLGLDVTTASDSGNAVKDFAVDVVKSFVGSPSNLGRTLAAGGLGATLLTKEDNKINTLKGGAKNAVSATIDTAIESPGMLVGGTLAGLAGAKGIGVLTKKPSVPAKIKTSDFKQTKPSGSTKTIDAEFTVKSGSQYKFKNKTKGNKRQNKGKGNIQYNDKIAASLNKNLRSDRAKAIGKKIELGSIDPFVNNIKIDLVNSRLLLYSGVRIKTIKNQKNFGSNKIGRTKVEEFDFDFKRNTQNSLITAKDARTPKNNSKSERARVRQVIEAQKNSGALFQDMELRNIPKRISNEKGLITAADARKPRNRTDEERRRVQRVNELQRLSGAAKPSASDILNWEIGLKNIGKKTVSGKKKTTKPTRRPRAYETRVTRITSFENDPNFKIIQDVPRYAVGASRPITITKSVNKPIITTKGGKIVFTRDGIITQPEYNLILEPARPKRLTRLPSPDKKPTGKGKGAGAKEKAKSESPTRKTKVEFEEIDVSRFVKSLNSPKKSNGSTAGKKQQQLTTRTTADGKPIKTNSKGESYVEVDNGNGTKAFVRVKTTSEPSTTKRSGSGAGAKSKAQAEKPKGKVNQTQKEKAKTVINRGKQTKVTGERSTKTAESRVIKTTKTKKGRVVMLLVNPGYQGNKNQVLISEAGSGTVVKPPIVVPDNITITKPDSDTTGDEKKTTKTLTITKPTTKGKNQQINKTKKKTQTPKTRTKKKTPVRLKEEKKKKKKVVKKVKDESALRLETVNQFGWLGLDKKPAAKPKRIKK